MVLYTQTRTNRRNHPPQVQVCGERVLPGKGNQLRRNLLPRIKIRVPLHPICPGHLTPGQELENQTGGRQECVPKRQSQRSSSHRTTQGIEKGKNMVLRLRKSLYGLKQTPREGHSTLRKALAAKEVLKTNFNPSIFMNRTGSIIIATFVDDLRSVYSDEGEEVELVQHLKTRFQITGRDPINWMVGINIIFSPDNIRLSQTTYIQRVLEQFDLKQCRPVSTQLENQALTMHSGEAFETTQFQAVIGCFMYAAVGTRPEITCTVTFPVLFTPETGPLHHSHTSTPVHQRDGKLRTHLPSIQVLFRGSHKLYRCKLRLQHQGQTLLLGTVLPDQ